MEPDLNTWFKSKKNYKSNKKENIVTKESVLDSYADPSFKEKIENDHQKKMMEKRRSRNKNKKNEKKEPVVIPLKDGTTKRELADEIFKPLADLINNGAPKKVIRKEERKLKKLHKQMMRL